MPIEKIRFVDESIDYAGNYIILGDIARDCVKNGDNNKGKFFYKVAIGSLFDLGCEKEANILLEEAKFYFGDI
jgi:hypothetical protein